MIGVYPADCTDFSTNGNGTLAPLSAEVTETLNGEYELTLVHPIDEAGKWQRLAEGCILRAPVPAAMTPRVNYTSPGDDNRTEIWRINTDISGAALQRGTMNLRNGPGRNYTILAAYKNTSLVQVIAKTNSAWYEVTAPDGKHGFMDTTYLVFDHKEGSVSEAVSTVVEQRQLRDQPFRIYRVVPELNKITVYARHIFYDLMDNMVQSYKPSSSVTGASVVQSISSHCLTEHGFTFYSDLTRTVEGASFENVNPVDALLGDEGVIAIYGGELQRDWFDAYVVKRVGKDTNVQIRQGKNLLGISYDEDLSSVVTRIMPTGQDRDGEVLYLPELFLDSPNIGAYPHPKWIHLPVQDAKESDDNDEPKTKEQCYAEMRAAAQKQFDTGCDMPTVTLNVDFINCAETEEYKEYGVLQNIYLGDTVQVIAPRIGVLASMRMTQYTYDCLTRKYTRMTLGVVADTINGLDSSIKRAASKIRSEVSDHVYDLNRSIAETASEIRSELSDTENGLRSSIAQTASQIRSEVSDSIIGLSSSIAQTASQIRSEVSDSVIGLNSSIAQTASQIRSEVSDSVNGLSSSITQSASQIRSEVSSSINNLNSSITQTASQIRSEVSDSINGLNSSITQTASQIRSEVANSTSTLYSAFEQSLSGFRSEVGDTLNGYSTTIQQNNNSIRTEVASAISAMYARIIEWEGGAAIEVREGNRVFKQWDNPSDDLMAGDIWVKSNDKRTWAEAGLNTWNSSQVYEWADYHGDELYVWKDGRWQLVVSSKELLVQGARLEVEQQEIWAVVDDNRNNLRAEMSLTASRFYQTLTDTANGLSSTISQTASQIRTEVSDANNGVYSYINQESDRIESVVENTASGLRSSITQTASQIRSEVSAQGNSLRSSITQTASQIRSEVSSSVNSVKSSITQQANRIDLVVQGTGSNAKIKPAAIVTAINDAASTVIISADHINLDGYVTMSDLSAVSAEIDNLVGGVTRATALKVNSLDVGTTFTYKNTQYKGVKLKIGSIISSTIFSTANADLDYDHYHSISASENNGVITITTGKARLSAGTANFNIADTAFYKAAMSARRVDNIIAARLTTPSYDTDTGNISASFRLTAQNGTGDDVTSLGSYDKTISISGETARIAGWNGAVDTVSLKGRKGSSGSYADIPSTGVAIDPGETYNVQARYTDSGGVSRSISRSITAANVPGFDISKLSINLGSDTDATAQTPTKTADRISGKIGIWYDGTYIGELRTFSFTINHGTPYINNHAQGYVRGAVTINGETLVGSAVKLTNSQISSWGGPV